jgi:hypothetical protein
MGNDLTVRFNISVKHGTESLVDFLLSESCFSERVLKIIFNNHPKLEKILKGKNKREWKKLATDYAHKFYREYNLTLLKQQKRVESVWRKVEKGAGVALTDILNTDWEGISKPTAEMGIISICPRYLQRQDFQYYYKEQLFQSLATILHEVTHFIYFKKWAQLFPQDKEDTYEAPHPVWHLSEIMAPILNNDPKLKVLIPDAEVFGYTDYNQKAFNKTGFLSIKGYFERNYLKFKNQGKSIEEFLTWARGKVWKMKFGF